MSQDEQPWAFVHMASEPEDLPFSLSVSVGSAPLPFFPEYPYFLWGEVNYNSDGDNQRPTDRDWDTLDLKNRETRKRISIIREEHGEVSISGDTASDVVAAASLTALRSAGMVIGVDGEVSLEQIADRLPNMVPRLREANEVQAMFLDPVLGPFDTNAWWGGWKWSGTFATDFTLGQRLTMKAVQDRKADEDLLNWLQDYWRQPVPDWHREGVRHALTVLTGIAPSEPK